MNITPKHVILYSEKLMYMYHEYYLSYLKYDGKLNFEALHTNCYLHTYYY